MTKTDLELVKKMNKHISKIETTKECCSCSSVSPAYYTSTTDFVPTESSSLEAANYDKYTTINENMDKLTKAVDAFKKELHGTEYDAAVSKDCESSKKIAKEEKIPTDFSLRDWTDIRLYEILDLDGKPDKVCEDIVKSYAKKVVDKTREQRMAIAACKAIEECLHEVVNAAATDRMNGKMTSYAGIYELLRTITSVVNNQLHDFKKHRLKIVGLDEGTERCGE